MSGGRRRDTSTKPAPGRGPDLKRMRPAGLVGAGGSEPLCTPQGQRSAVLLPCGGADKEGSSSAPAMAAHHLTVVDEDVLDCGVCFLPLKPPIFQCAVGHALCSPCSEELNGARTCHLCGVAMPGGYQRCHALERVVDSICGPCTHVPYGCCDARLEYHAIQEHVRQCRHAPCHCPGGDGCSFVGSVTALVEHVAVAHGWPCTAEPCASIPFDVNLRDGFNFLTAVRGDTQYLLLLNVASTPFGDAVSAVWIRSVAAMASASVTVDKKTTCDLELRFRQFKDVQRGHYQRSRFQLPCTCPSNGLPDPNASFQFFFPKYLGGPDQATLRVVNAAIYIETGI